jgi:hypothetical protein
LEAPYIKRNIAATLAGFGVQSVKYHSFADQTSVPSAVLKADAPTLSNIRLWDPASEISLATVTRRQSIRSYYTFNSLAVDRYLLRGKVLPVLIGARELSTANLPSPSWVNTHLQYTHGVGVAVLAANQVEFAKQLQDATAPEFAKIGLALNSVTVQNLSLPEELQKVLDQKIGMGMVGGDMGKFMQYQTAQAIPKFAENAGQGGGVVNDAMGLGAGVALGQVMAQQLNQGLQAAPAAAACAMAEVATAICAVGGGDGRGACRRRTGGQRLRGLFSCTCTSATLLAKRRSRGDLAKRRSRGDLAKRRSRGDLAKRRPSSQALFVRWASLRHACGED